MTENQQTITTWQENTFGPSTPKLAFERMQKEYWELRDMLHELDHGNADQYDVMIAGAECADVLITLYRVAETLGIDLHKMVDEKMKINRARKWQVDSKGHGQHIKAP